MATLEEQLNALIAEHRLSSLTICRIAGSNGPFWAIDAQGDKMIGTNGPFHRPETAEDGIAMAITALNKKRAVPVDVPALAPMAEAA